jgi:hypothetical protein
MDAARNLPEVHAGFVRAPSPQKQATMPTPSGTAPAWQLQWLGGLRATRQGAVLARFPSRAVAMLFARLIRTPMAAPGLRLADVTTIRGPATGLDGPIGVCVGP